MIVNRSENTDKSMFERSHKVAAIFNADNVFDCSHSLTHLVGNSEMDRQPFKYDLQQSTPGEQQRWMVVERHAATNRQPIGPK